MGTLPWLRFLVALLIAMHGLVYLNAARGVLPVFEGWKERSWLLGGTLTGDRLRHLSVLLWSIAGIGLLVFATLLAFAFPALGVWRPVAIVASAVAIVGFWVFWDGQLRKLLDQGLIGMVFSLVLLVVVIAFPALSGLAAN